MEISEAIHLIEGGVAEEVGIWADIGAGTGLFSQCLDQLLPENSQIFALDKSPHALYTLEYNWKNDFHIVEGNFDTELSIPICDGILIANTLHYSDHPKETLENVFKYLKVGGKIIFVEYELEEAKPPWIPYPLSYKKLKKIMNKFSFSPLVEMGRTQSAYGHQYIYSASAEKIA